MDRPEKGCAIVHSDSAAGIQRLNPEAAKVMVRGGLTGLGIEEVSGEPPACRASPTP